jgi:hypothetical protein
MNGNFGSGAAGVAALVLNIIGTIVLVAGLLTAGVALWSLAPRIRRRKAS